VKLLIVDTETSGLDPGKNGMLQLAALLCIKSEVHEFSAFMNPGKSVVYEPEALAVNGLSLDSIGKAEPDVTVYRGFAEWLSRFVDRYDFSDKTVMAGYGVAFDDSFLRSLAMKSGDKYLGSYRWNDLIEIRSLAIMLLHEQRHSMPNFKLTTVAETIGGCSVNLILTSMGVQLGRPHDALTDCYLAKYVLDCFLGTFKISLY
jgi:DNA polymerase III epsilon subunit-like protein